MDLHGVEIDGEEWKNILNNASERSIDVLLDTINKQNE
jgi:hypothetical protein